MPRRPSPNTTAAACAVRYRIARDACLAGYACHCTDCHTRSGGSCAVQLPCRRDAIAMTGEVMAATHPGKGDVPVTQVACPRCLTRLYSFSDRRPGFAIVRAGTLDDSATFVPAFHIWTASAPSWVEIPGDVPCFAHAPPEEDWPRLLTGRNA